MFKKPIKLGGQNQLSGKDKKTIKNKLVAQFDPETVEKLFANNDKIICSKVSGSKMLLYVSDDYPLFVDGTGKEEYFLSVYTGAAYEPLSKRLYINEGVEGFIFNGANLMWPGVKDLSRLGNFKKDEIVSIVNSANEVIAIGAMGCSLDELKNNADGSGIAVYILHFRGDKLWDLGTKVYPEVIVKAKEPKIEAKVQQPVVAQPKVEVKPAPEESKPEKGKGKKEVKQVKEDSESEPEEPVKQKAKDKKEKRVSFNQEVQVSQPKGKGKGKKEKKAESDQQPEEPVKAKGKGKKDKKVDSDQEKPEEPVKGKGKGKKEKKQESDEEKVEEAPKGKGKGKKQTKEQKAPPKKKEESQQSDDDIDFGNLVHDKKPARVQPPKAQKKVIQFSDEEDDKKGKKKGGKKGGNKKKQSDDEEFQAPKPKQEHKGKKKAEDSDEEVQPRQKKGKNKKQQSDQQEPEVEKVEKKKGKKDKKKKDESDDQNEEEIKQEKPAKVEQGEQENEEGAKSAINGQLMDEYFKEAFLNVLKLSKVQAQLPIDSGRFFSDYMILARPEGVKLEIKDTTYKKLGKFYEEMAKKKFIEFKPAKEKKGQQGSTITKIFWQNEEFKNYFPTIKKMGDKDVEEKVEQYSKQKLKLTKTLQVEYVYKLSEQLKKILLKKVINYMPDKSDDEEGKQEKKEVFFTEKDLKEKIEKYINQIALKDSKEGKEPKEPKEPKEGKEGKDKEKKTDKIITLNYKENEFIYGLLKKQIEEYEQNLEKEEMMAQHDSDEQEKKKGKKEKNKKSLFRLERGLLVNKIMKLASPYYNMSDKSTGLNKFKQGTFKGIQLIADKVINKNVTKIIGLESFAPSNVEADQLVKQIHGFAHQLQVKFASSANVQNLPGKNAGKEIVIQGNFVDELETILTTEFAIKKEYITIQNKLGKKKKN